VSSQSPLIDTDLGRVEGGLIGQVIILKVWFVKEENSDDEGAIADYNQVISLQERSANALNPKYSSNVYFAASTPMLVHSFRMYQLWMSTIWQ
jgi:hypothetical protein